MNGTTTVTLKMAGLDREDLRLLRSALNDKLSQINKRLSKLRDEYTLADKGSAFEGRESLREQLDHTDDQHRRVFAMFGAATSMYNDFPLKLEATLAVDES